jgi:hypothetical protein
VEEVEELLGYRQQDWLARILADDDASDSKGDTGSGSEDEDIF